MSRQALVRCIGKFAVVGGLGTLVNTGLLLVLYSYLRLPLVAASALATELAVGNNYLWNNYWTFERRAASLGQFARFNLVALAGQCITVATLWVLVRYTGLPLVVANLTGIGLALVWNFTVNLYWTWGATTQSTP
jgi:putative flippase GtrA